MTNRVKFNVPGVGMVAIEDELVSYDGPVLFTVRGDNGGRYFAYWVDDSDTESVFWYSPISDGNYRALLRGDIEVRTPFVEQARVLEIRRSISTGEYTGSDWKKLSDGDLSALPEVGYYFEASEFDRALSAGFVETAHVIAVREGRAVARFVLDRGKGVHEASAISAAGVILSCQRLLHAIGASLAKANNTPWVKEKTNIALRPLVASSLGIELVATAPSEMMNLSLVENSLNKMLDLFQAGANQASLKEQFSTLNTGAAKSYRDLLRSLAKSESDVFVEAGMIRQDGERQAPLNKIQIQEMMDAMKAVEKEKSEHVFEARLSGGDTEKLFFHVRRVSDDEEFSGKVSGHAVDALQNAQFNKKYLVQILETIVYGSVTDEPKSTYELIEMDEVV